MANSSLKQNKQAKNESKLTHFRTWKSGKRWLYAASLFVAMLEATAASEIIITPAYANADVVSASSTSTTPTVVSNASSLTPGSAIDTGNHTFSKTDLLNHNDWSLSGQNASPSWAGNWVNFNNDGKDKVGYSLFDDSFDMSKPVSFTAALKANNGAYSNSQLGDALGFFFTSADSTDALKGDEGAGLGIQGISDTTFVGRDYYSNDSKHTNDGITDNYATNSIIIRQTDASGNMQTALASANPKINESGEGVTFNWNPTKDNGDGTVTGTLTYT